MGISIWQLLIILVIVLLLFGAKRLRNVGGDLGQAVKGFKDSMKDDESKKDAASDQRIESQSAEPEETTQSATNVTSDKDKV